MCKKRNVTNMLLSFILMAQVFLCIVSIQSVKIAEISTIAEPEIESSELESEEAYSDNVICDIITFSDKDYYNMQDDLERFVSTGWYSEWGRYGDSLEIIDIEYQNYYMTILNSEEVLIWEATVIFEYQDGDVYYEY